MKATPMTLEEWLEKFKPLLNTINLDSAPFDGLMYEPTGPEYAKINELYHRGDVGKIWTLMDDDKTIKSGLWLKNPLGYFVTEVKVPEGTEIMVVIHNDVPANELSPVAEQVLKDKKFLEMEYVLNDLYLQGHIRNPRMKQRVLRILGAGFPKVKSDEASKIITEDWKHYTVLNNEWFEKHYPELKDVSREMIKQLIIRWNHGEVTEKHCILYNVGQFPINTPIKTVIDFYTTPRHVDFADPVDAMHDDYDKEGVHHEHNDSQHL